MKIRNVQETDYDYVIERLNEWWRGRNMADMLPRLFFIHFQDTSFVCLKGDRIIGFISGFISSTQQDSGYIHFAGVDPDFRRCRVATSLYYAFFDCCKKGNIKYVKCVTSPVNNVSIAFHQSLGFKAFSYDSQDRPVPVQNYDGPGQDRVIFKLQLSIQK